MIEETRIKGYCEYDSKYHVWKIGNTDFDDILSQFVGNEITIIIRNNNNW